MPMNRFKRTATAVALTALVSACATVPPEEDPVLLKLNELDRRLAAVERVVQNDSLVQLVTRVDALQAEQAELRGMIEELASVTSTWISTSGFSASSRRRAARAAWRRDSCRCPRARTGTTIRPPSSC